MKFEFDAKKSRANKEKHGIDFHEAQTLWEDDDLTEITILSTSEIRHVFTGKIRDKYWTVVITWRSNTIRLISVRRSRKSEVSIYEKEKRQIH
jgi:uncharacterized protein